MWTRKIQNCRNIYGSKKKRRFHNPHQSKIPMDGESVKKLKDFPESTKVVRKVQLTKLGSVVKASEKSISAITDSITDSIRRKKKV